MPSKLPDDSNQKDKNDTQTNTNYSVQEACTALTGALPSSQLQVLTLSYLTTEEFRPWTQSSLYRSRFFKSMLHSRFLEYVVREEYEVVQSMLRKDPYLMVQQGAVTDCSERAFTKISGFEYALWAWSKHMWEAMLDCVPGGKEGHALWGILLSQYNKVSKVGVTYRRKGITITEHHFDYANTIILQLQLQVNAQNSPGKKDWDAIGTQSNTGVGGAQNDLPIHVVDEYCSGKAFDPEPDFNTRPKSTRKFYIWNTGDDEDWFHVGSRLGIDFAIYRGRGSGALWHAGACRGSAAADDLIALTALFEIRSIDFINLGVRLEQTVAAENQLPIAPI